MVRSILFSLLALCGLCAGCSPSSRSAAELVPRPPAAEVRPHELRQGDHARSDPYFWLRERDDPQVLDYLTRENEYTDAVMTPTRRLRKKLFRELKGRIKESDTSVPYREDGYYYYTRFEPGREYPIYCRKSGSLEAAEEVMIDVNLLGEGQAYFAVRPPAISSERNLAAYAEDRVGRRIYSIRFKDLASGETLEDVIPDVTGNLAWANDNKTLFYTKQDPMTLRAYRVYRHVLGTDPMRDELVYEEKDDTFGVSVWKSKSKRYVMIGSFQTLSSEIRFIEADQPAGEFRVLLPREADHEYVADHFGDHFYIRTNDKARNFRLVRTPVERTEKRSWEEVIPHRDEVLLESFEIFRDQLVVTERRNGLIELRIRPWSGDPEHYLDFGEPAYLAYVDRNPEFDTPILRFGYTSMTTPRSTYDYDMNTRQKTLLKQVEVLGGFNGEDYITERIHATARDGAQVPISLVYRRGIARDGTNPLLLYGYGSYGSSMEARFSSARLSLLDRGFVFAIAHVRGGEELGRQWYEDGKLLRKKNTFTDFIDCAESLIEKGYADPQRLFAQGGSAGGLLMGAVINMRPDLFFGVVAAVPFVDVVTTMLDDSIPLTTGEYDEWGNPNDPQYYEYMLSYSPYDNVERKSYPNLLVTTGLHDSQVQYWEPAKWVAKLRATKTDGNRLLLRTNMEAGHGGASGRFRRLEETAFAYAFMLDLAGIRK